MKAISFLFCLLFISPIFGQNNTVFMVDAALIGDWKIQEIKVDGKVLTEHQEFDEWRITADKRYVMSRKGIKETIQGRWEIKYESVFVFYPDESSETPHFEVLKIHPTFMDLQYIDEGEKVHFKLIRK
jgi:hypothetical protein